MRENQRYFTLSHADGSPAPWFALVANVPGSADNGRTIIGGNERVLRARLSDARFFWDLDLKTKLEDRLPALEAITFHAKLGTVRQKAERIAALARYLAVACNAADRLDEAEIAGRLAKADLVTGMVGEFPELQGLMGGYYGRAEGLSAPVATAIADHYKPAGPSDRCPSEPLAIAVALADKLDTLAGFFAINELPTGSRDPYALRRAAIGIIRLIRENTAPSSVIASDSEAIQTRGHNLDCFVADAPRNDGVRLRLDGAILAALQGYASQGTSFAADTHEAIFAFIIDRLKVFLKESGIRPDYIDAALVAGDHDLVRIVRRAEALQAFLSSPDGESLLAAYNRATKIVQDEGAKDGTNYRMESIDPAFLKEAEEADLLKKLEPAVEQAQAFTNQEAFADCMALLATLRPPIDGFFTKVLVNDPDQALRRNRLALLARFARAVETIADFSKIEIK
jgi:glycyl-tRNA synthetase beta chain